MRTLAVIAFLSVVLAPGPSRALAGEVPFDPFASARAGDWERLQVQRSTGLSRTVRYDAFWEVASADTTSVWVQSVVGRPVELPAGSATLAAILEAGQLEGLPGCLTQVSDTPETVTIAGTSFSCRKIGYRVDWAAIGSEAVWFCPTVPSPGIVKVEADLVLSGSLAPYRVRGELQGYGRGARLLWGMDGPKHGRPDGCMMDVSFAAREVPEYGTPFLTKGFALTERVTSGGVHADVTCTIGSVAADKIGWNLTAEGASDVHVDLPRPFALEFIPTLADEEELSVMLGAKRTGSGVMSVGTFTVAYDVYEKEVDKGKKVQVWIATNLPPIAPVKEIDANGDVIEELVAVHGEP